MKFTIEGFSQKKLIEYNLDIVDAAILRYFIDFRDSGNMFSKVIGEKQYNWIRYEAVIEALPILSLNKPDSVYRRLKRMAELNILESVTVKQGGVYSFYRTGPNYLDLISDINPTKTDTNPRKSDGNPEQNINLLYKSNNNSSINNTYEEIIDYLNEVTGSKFKYTTKETQKLIKAKLKEGFTTDDFKKVIDNKFKEWKGTEWEKYLVPSTLFAVKFETYLNQKIGKVVSINKAVPNSNGKQSNFNNHTQRAYDGSDGGMTINDIEKQLLGWK